MTELEILQSVIRTLDSLTVSGTENMKKLVGCIDALTQIVAIEECRPEKGSEDDGGQSN